MNTLEEMSDRELLEFIFGAQTVLIGKIQRIENHLSKDNEEVYRESDTRRYDEVYEDLKNQVEEVQRQINIRVKD